MEIVLKSKPEGCKILIEETYIDAPYPAQYRTHQFTMVCEAGIVQVETSGHLIIEGLESVGRIAARMCVSCPSRLQPNQVDTCHR